MTMQFEGAKITEQGVTFGIVIVKPHVLHSSQEQIGAGIPTYQGRPDIVRFLSNVFIEQIPWQQYTLSAV